MLHVNVSFFSIYTGVGRKFKLVNQWSSTLISLKLSLYSYIILIDFFSSFLKKYLIFKIIILLCWNMKIPKYILIIIKGHEKWLSNLSNLLKLQKPIMADKYISNEHDATTYYTMIS